MLAIWSSISLVALVLLVRRLSGGFHNLLPLWAMCLTTVFTAGAGLAAYAIHWSVTRRFPENAANRWLPSLMTLLPALLVGIALLPEYTVTSISFLALTVLLIGAALWLFSDNPAFLDRIRQPSVSQVESLPPDDAANLLSGTFHGSLDSDRREWFQQMTRTQTKDGRDVLDGTFVVRLAQGKKQATIHQPFSPPFGVRPAVTCNVGNACAVRVKAASIYPFGVRFEVRHSPQVAGDEVAEIVFQASAPALITDSAAGVRE